MVLFPLSRSPAVSWRPDERYWQAVARSVGTSDSVASPETPQSIWMDFNDRFSLPSYRISLGRLAELSREVDAQHTSLQFSIRPAM